MTTYKVVREEGGSPLPWLVIATEYDGWQHVLSQHRTRALAQLAIVEITQTTTVDKIDP